MKPRDIEKLLGGYATGTLTDEERRTLFEAALNSQDLFDGLADEEALRELLSDPVARQRLLLALQPAEAPARRGWLAWLARPSSWALAGGLAAAAVIAVIVVRTGDRAITPVALKRTAETERQALSVAPPPAAEPAPPLAKPKASPPVTRRKAAPQARERKDLPAPPVVAGATAPPAPMQAEAMSEFRRAESDVAAVSAPPLRYAVLKRAPDGVYIEALPDSDFTSGDSIRFRIDAGQDGYLYVYERQPSGGLRLVQPGGIRVARGTRLVVPVAGGIEFGESPGDKRLLLVLSRQPEPAFLAQTTRMALRDEPRRAANAPTAPAEASSRDISLQKTAERKAEAVGEGRFILEITLKRRNP